ncbi:MAG: hypothetical protein ALAOOOJD_01599 [bacterium]|nr:hypothetical protein [bacterium]
MLLFRSEEHVERWCKTHNLPRRPLVSLEQLWQLAVIWYANRLTEESRRPGPDEMGEIFDKLGLRGTFWQVRR